MSGRVEECAVVSPLALVQENTDSSQADSDNARCARKIWIAAMQDKSIKEMVKGLQKSTDIDEIESKLKSKGYPMKKDMALNMDPTNSIDTRDSASDAVAPRTIAQYSGAHHSVHCLKCLGEKEPRSHR
ncbi:hypothetical protein NPIL_395461 [Nephila pilipes]|uniref:Uncharacterized protein n=1 Tax=Nephila pilipes TaxID=299642 RepID=A0A8X6JC13_NEPPI|nr:hypothetical protein NPIL_395461 [Nephila pilipes]